MCPATEQCWRRYRAELLHRSGLDYGRVAKRKKATSEKGHVRKFKKERISPSNLKPKYNIPIEPVEEPNALQ